MFQKQQIVPAPDGTVFTYSLPPAGTGVVRSDGLAIPPSPTNRDWKAYQAWVAAGHTAAPFVAATVVPQSITAAQAKIALLKTGMLDRANAVITAATDPAVAIYWASAPNWDRQNPAFLGLAAGLNLTSDQIDALFTLAATF